MVFKGKVITHDIENFSGVESSLAHIFLITLGGESAVTTTPARGFQLSHGACYSKHLLTTQYSLKVTKSIYIHYIIKTEILEDNKFV